MSSVVHLHSPNASIGQVLSKGSKPQFSPHPDWVKDYIKDVEPYQKRVWQCRLVEETSRGVLSLCQMRGWLIQLYPFIETFPQWLALNIAKAPDAFSEAFGISGEELEATRVIPEVEALTHYMWSINLRGSLAESMSAMSYAIEGTTQGIAREVLKGFPKYDGRYGIRLTKRACAWMYNHSRYDEAHPLEALEIIKRSTLHEDMKGTVTQVAQRSMEYFLMALDACYEHFSPLKGLRMTPHVYAA